MQTHFSRARLSLPVILSFALIAAAYVALLAIVATSPPHPVYDEDWYLATTALLRQDGFSIAFLRNLPGPAGPTFTVVYAAVIAVFGPSLPWLRLVGVALLLASTTLLVAILRTLKIQSPDRDAAANGLLPAGMLIMLPTVAASSGMTLTEIPAVTFALIGTLALATNDRRDGSFAACGVAGLTFGAAILGRQNYLVLLPCLALLVDWSRSRASFGRLFVAGAIAVAICGPVFLIWGRLVPPRTAFFGTAIHPWHFILSAGYLGLISLFIEPRVYRPLINARALVALALISLAAGAGFAAPQVPARTALSALGPAPLQILGWAFSGAITFLATAFLAMMLTRLYQARDDRLLSFAGAVVILCALSNIGLLLFSSRYIFIAVPFLVIFLAPALKASWDLPVRLATGAAIGLVSLSSYFR